MAKPPVTGVINLTNDALGEDPEEIEGYPEGYRVPTLPPLEIEERQNIQIELRDAARAYMATTGDFQEDELEREVDEFIADIGVDPDLDKKAVNAWAADGLEEADTPYYKFLRSWIPRETVVFGVNFDPQADYEGRKEAMLIHHLADVQLMESEDDDGNPTISEEEAYSLAQADLDTRNASDGFDFVSRWEQNYNGIIPGVTASYRDLVAQSGVGRGLRA